jgi:hypothetical protein
MYRFRIQEYSNGCATELTQTPFLQEEAQSSMITTSTAIYAYRLLQKRVPLHGKAPTLHVSCTARATGVAFLVVSSSPLLPPHSLSPSTLLMVSTEFI